MRAANGRVTDPGLGLDSLRERPFSEQIMARAGGIAVVDSALHWQEKGAPSALVLLCFWRPWRQAPGSAWRQEWE